MLVCVGLNLVFLKIWTYTVLVYDCTSRNAISTSRLSYNSSMLRGRTRKESTLVPYMFRIWHPINSTTAPYDRDSSTICSRASTLRYMAHKGHLPECESLAVSLLLACHSRDKQSTMVNRKRMGMAKIDQAERS